MKFGRTLLVLFSIACLLSIPSSAVPSRPHFFNLTQPDGNVFSARQRGDEFGAWIENEQGYSIVQKDNAWWVVARERKGVLGGSFIRADASSEFLEGIAKHQKQEGFNPVEGEPVKGHSPYSIKSFTNGTVKVLMILVNFTDNPRVDANTYKPAYYSNLYFNVSNPASMAYYYNESSYGLVNVSGVIGGNKWYTSQYSMAHYGTDCSGIDYCPPANQGTYNLICEAAALADADINYADYDLDSDGYIDSISIVHAGCGQEEGPFCSMSNTLWSVRWSYFMNFCPQTYDGKGIRNGIITAEDSPIGTVSHESGHDFANLPDLYDIDYSSEGIGCWGIMSSGIWNGPPGQAGTSPAQFSAWSKYFMGWVYPTVVTTPLLDEEVEAAETVQDIYQIMIPLNDSPQHPSSGGEKEYFLVENRQQIGFDTYLPGAGLLVWHIEDDQSRLSNNEFNKYCCYPSNDRGLDLEEADEDTQAQYGLDGNTTTGTGDRGVAADAWKSDSGGFTDSTTPNSKSKAGTATYINITNISASGLTMTVDFLGSGTKRVTPEISLTEGNVTPQVGYTDELFNYTVVYTSSNDSIPDSVNVLIEGEVQVMVGSDLADSTFSDGKSYFYNTSLSAGSHNFSFNASSAGIVNSTSVFNGPAVTVRPGYLTATLSEPNSSIIVSQYLFFNTTAIVSCVGGDCGNVTAVLNYSEGIIPQSSGTPFYTIDANPMFSENLSCLTNLSVNESCNVTWTVNATGVHNTTYWVLAFFNTSFSQNVTESVNLTINSLVPVISNPSPENNSVFEPYTAYFSLNISTHRISVCRHSNVSGVEWENMTDTFASTNSTDHSTNVTGLSNNESVDLFIKCQSFDGYVNSEDYHLQFNVSTPMVFINEFNPTSNWIEIANAGDTNVNLTSWILEYIYNSSSDNHSLTSYLTDYLVLWENITNITLRDDGELILYDREGGIADNISYSDVTENSSFGRQTDFSNNWMIFGEPTPGATNLEFYSLDWPMFRQNPGRTGVTPINISSQLVEQWNLTIGSRVRSSPAILENTVYASSWEGDVFGLNLSSGEVLWNYSSGYYVTSSPAVASGRLYIGTLNPDGLVLCLNASDGDLIWEYNITEGIESSPLVSSDIVYIGSNNGVFYAINSSIGTQLWNYTTSGMVRSSPALNDGIVYFGSDDYKIYALYSQNGSLKWSFPTLNRVYSTPAVSGDSLYVGSYDGVIYSLNASDGSFIWDFNTSGSILSSTTVSDDLVFVGSNDRNLYVINATSGDSVWNITTWDEIVASPAVSGDFIVSASKDRSLLIMDKYNGTALWGFNAGQGILSSPSISGGMIFSGADDGLIYAFGILNDTDLPNVTLVWPGIGYTAFDGDLNLVYEVNDESTDLANCSLFLNEFLNQTSPSVSEGVNQSFMVLNLVNGSYNWSVQCTDDSVNSNVGESLTYSFNVSLSPLNDFLGTLVLGWNLIGLPRIIS